MSAVFEGPPELVKWFQERPPQIQELILKRDFRKLYRMKSTGHVVEICSYQEAAETALEKCGFCKAGALPGHSHLSFPGLTLTVKVTREYNPRLIMERKVFGIDPEDLEEVPDPTLSTRP